MYVCGPTFILCSQSRGSMHDMFDGSSFWAPIQIIQRKCL